MNFKFTTQLHREPLSVEDQLDINKLKSEASPEQLRSYTMKRDTDLLEIIKIRKYVESLDPKRDVNEGLTEKERKRLKDGLSAMPTQRETFLEWDETSARLQRERKKRMTTGGDPRLFNPYEMVGVRLLMKWGAHMDPIMKKTVRT